MSTGKIDPNRDMSSTLQGAIDILDEVSTQADKAANNLLKTGSVVDAKSLEEKIRKTDANIPNNTINPIMAEADVDTETNESIDAMVKHLGQLDTALLNVTRSPTIKSVVRTEEQKAFITEFTPIAKEVEKLVGIDFKVPLAQIAIETGWGRVITEVTDDPSGLISEHKTYKTYNVFNITTGSSWTGRKGYLYTTTEGVHQFRIYPDYLTCARDYAKLINTTSRYAVAKSKVSRPDQYIDELARQGWAGTDNTWSDLMKAIYNALKDYIK